jgi:hypothetical protein
MKSFFLRPLRHALVLSLFATMACGSGTTDSQSPSADAQMNDLSILYPLAKGQAEYDGYLSVSSPGRGGSMLPPSVFGSSSPAPDVEDSLRVVAMRLDPCFAHIGPITDPASCSPQLRLVFQPVGFFKGVTSANDNAVHGFYSLTQTEFSEALEAIIQLRKANSNGGDLGPLAVHPILSKQGVDGPMGQGLASIIMRYAGRENCVRVAMLDAVLSATPSGAVGGGEAWGMSLFDVVNGALQPLPIPTMSGAKSDQFFQLGGKGFDVGFAGPLSSKDDIELLADAKAFGEASDAAREKAFDAAVQIENPDLNSPNTIDCASCHLAQPSRELVGAKFGFSTKGNPDAFTPDPKFVSPADFAETTSVDPTKLNFHAFSYLGTEPAINQRVINETAAIVAYLHQSQN